MKNMSVEQIKQKIGEYMSAMQNTTCCFTGHRYQKLPWGANENDGRCKLMKSETREEILKAIQKGYTYFISGMAIGFDMICAEIVLELKKDYPFIKLECAVPCLGQELKWNMTLQRRYHNILSQADHIRFIYDSYEKGCMKERNEYMVKCSSLVIALFDGKPGGTAQTINYAKSQGVEVIVITPKKEKIDEVVDFFNVSKIIKELMEKEHKECTSAEEKEFERIKEKLKELNLL